MQITWHGISCFRITENVNGHEVSIVIDPFQPADGFKLPRNLVADVVVSSHDHDSHNNIEAVGAATAGERPFVIDGPGEFEVKDAFVTGISTFHDLVDGKEKGTNTMFYVTVGDLRLAHLGDLKHPLTEKHLNDFQSVDILFVPCGGDGTLDAKQAAEIVGQLEPRVIIPMHYKDAGPFLRAMGAAKGETLPKLKISKKDLPQEESRVVVLDPQ